MAALTNFCLAHPAFKGGYAYPENLSNGDTVTVELGIQPRQVCPSGKNAENTGRIAFMRDPLVYCVEGMNHDGDVRGLSVKRGAPVEALGADRIGGAPKLHTAGSSAVKSRQLYSPEPPLESDRDIILVPYFAWANRSVSPIRCYLPEKG